jgi:hypothetical protein
MIVLHVWLVLDTYPRPGLDHFLLLTTLMTIASHLSILLSTKLVISWLDIDVINLIHSEISK